LEKAVAKYERAQRKDYRDEVVRAAQKIAAYDDTVNCGHVLTDRMKWIIGVLEDHDINPHASVYSSLSFQGGMNWEEDVVPAARLIIEQFSDLSGREIVERDETLQERRDNYTRPSHPSRFTPSETIEKQKERVDDWKDGQYGTTAISAWSRAEETTLLREKDGRVETSLGARVPVDEAKDLYRMVCAVRRSGQDRRFSGQKIGIYDVDHIEADGTLHAGCHTIAFEEIKRMAGRLNLNGETTEPESIAA
jgi:hypothetical protein